MKFGEDFFKKHNWDEIQDFYNSGHKWKEILKKFKISNKGLTLAIKNGWFKTRGRSESMKILLKNNPRKHTDETKRKISEIRKKYLEENPNKVPYLLNHSRDESYPEKYFKNVFDNEGILVVRYFRIGLYELDFCIPEKKIDIEIDGCQHYLDEKIKISDEIRNKFLMEQGWDIIRIIWSDYQKMDSESKLKFIRELKEYINGLVQNKHTIVIKDKQICDCGKKKYRYSKKCQDCSIIERRIVERPNIEILLKEIDEMGYCATGRKYGVSDNTIRKWSKNNIVLVSEQTAPEDFKCIWKQEISRSIKPNSKTKTTEKLFIL